MLSFLWACIVIFFKGMIGCLLVAGGMIVVLLSIAAIVAIIQMSPRAPKKPERKKPEDWKQWANKQEGELKSLLNEIDKDLKNETK